jgi:hypothetical protein
MPHPQHSAKPTATHDQIHEPIDVTIRSRLILDAFPEARHRLNGYSFELIDIIARRVRQCEGHRNAASQQASR